MLSKIPLTAGALKASLIANLVFAPLLLLSLGGNVWQLRTAWIEDGEDQAAAQGAKDLAEQIGKVEAMAESAARAAFVADEAAADRHELLADLRVIADRGRERVTVYRDRVKQLPPAACAPGPERVEATNELLRGD